MKAISKILRLKKKNKLIQKKALLILLILAGYFILSNNQILEASEHIFIKRKVIDLFFIPPRLHNKSISIFCLGVEPYVYATSFLAFLKMLLKDSALKDYLHQNSKKFKFFISFFFASFQSFFMFKSSSQNLRDFFLYYKVLLTSCSSLLLAIAINLLDQHIGEKAISLFFFINFISWKLADNLFSYTRILVFIFLQLWLMVLKNLGSIIHLANISQTKGGKIFNLSFLKIRPYEIGNIPVLLAFSIYNYFSDIGLIRSKHSFLYFCFLVYGFALFSNFFYFNSRKLATHLKKRSIFVTNKSRIIKSDNEAEAFIIQKIAKVSMAYIFIFNFILIFLCFLFKETLTPLKEVEKALLEHFLVSNIISDILTIGSNFYFENKFEKLNSLITKEK